MELESRLFFIVIHRGLMPMIGVSWCCCWQWSYIISRCFHLKLLSSTSIHGETKKRLMLFITGNINNSGNKPHHIIVGKKLHNSLHAFSWYSYSTQKPTIISWNIIGINLQACQQFELILVVYVINSEYDNRGVNRCIKLAKHIINIVRFG